MKFSNTEEKKNNLMKRKDLKINVDYEGRATPSKAELQLAISKQFSVEIDKVEIKNMISSTGKAEGILNAKIWDEKKVKVYGKKDEPKTEETPAVEEKPKVEELKKE